MTNTEFIINPNMRLNLDTLALTWIQVPSAQLNNYAHSVPAELLCLLRHQCQCLITQVERDITIYYSELTEFAHIRVQAWLRRALNEAIQLRANQIIPGEFHQAELFTNLHAKRLRITKLRNKRTMGDCSQDNIIRITPKVVIMPVGIRREVYIHELCHTRHHNHSKRFWALLSSFLGIDAKQSKLATDVFLSRFFEQMSWLTKNEGKIN